MIEVICIDPTGYEWLLTKGVRYKVDSWNDKTIVIHHPTCGIYGMFAKRFTKVLPPSYIGFIKCQETQ